MKFFCEHCGTNIDPVRDNTCPNCKAPYDDNKEYIKNKERIEKEREEMKKAAKEIKDFAGKTVKNFFGINIAMIVIAFIIIITVIGIIVFSVTRDIKHKNNIIDDITNTTNYEENVEEFIEKAKDSVSKEVYNVHIESYAGTEIGFFVKNLLDQVNTNIKKYTERTIHVIYKDKNTNIPEEIIKIKDTLNKNKNYEVEFEYDSDGYIYQVKLTDK